MKWPFANQNEIDFFGAGIEVLDHKTQLAKFTSTLDTRELELSMLLLQPGDRAVVAGVGLGTLLAPIASLLGVENVKGYEPNPMLTDLVRRYVKVGGKQLNVICAALAAQEGMQQFMLADHFTRSSLTVTPKSDFVNLDVPTQSIANAMNGYNALMLDVEGAEWDILPCMDFTTIRVIIMEFHLDEKFGHENVDVWLKFMETCGLKIVDDYKHPNAKQLRIVGATR
jgi:FkbM family methyltransferase